jgi:uncharacterized protein
MNMSQFQNNGVQVRSEEYDAIRGLNAYIAKVYGWMFLGLALTALTAFLFSTNVQLVISFVKNPFLLYGSVIGEFVLVIAISRAIMKLSFPAAASLFGIYAILNGLTLSVILLLYTGSSVASTFFITAFMFGSMSIYGRVTQVDLTKFRGMLTMGLIGVIGLSVLNIFLRSSVLEWIVTLVGLFVFLGLTAYDMQKLKTYYASTQGDMVMQNKLGLLGALSLYLDFINLFLMVLRLFGRRR